MILDSLFLPQSCRCTVSPKALVRCALRHALGEASEPWTIKEQAAWSLVPNDLNIPLALHRDEACLPLNGHAHSLCPLRNAWYRVLTPPDACRPSPRLSAAPGVVDPAVCIPLSAQLTAALAWWCFPVFSSFLRDGAFFLQLGETACNLQCLKLTSDASMLPAPPCSAVEASLMLMDNTVKSVASVCSRVGIMPLEIGSISSAYCCGSAEFPTPESSGAGAILVVVFNNSMHSFNDELP